MEVLPLAGGLEPLLVRSFFGLSELAPPRLSGRRPTAAGERPVLSAVSREPLVGVPTAVG